MLLAGLPDVEFVVEVTAVGYNLSESSVVLTSEVTRTMLWTLD